GAGGAAGRRRHRRNHAALRAPEAGVSPRTPWGLAALCAILGGALVASELWRPSPGGLPRSALVPLAAREGRRATLARGESRAELTRQAEEWWFADDGRADRRAVEAALSEMELLSHGGFVAGATPSPANGLIPPRLAVTLRGTNAQVRIDFGAPAD